MLKLPYMKRISLVLWQMIKSGKFIWSPTHEHAWGNIKYLCSLQIKNFIFQPHLPLLVTVDSSAVEKAMFLFQILRETIDLRIITCKSKLLTEAERRKPPTSREADAISDGIDMAEPYLLQSTAKSNYLFSDMASVQYISRNKAFSNFLLELSMKISKFPNLHAIWVPGRVLYLADLFSRQCDYVQFERKSTNLSKEQSSVLPAISCIKPGSIIDSDTLKKLLHAIPQEEFLDINEGKSLQE